MSRLRQNRQSNNRQGHFGNKWTLSCWRTCFCVGVPTLKTCPHFMRGRLRECFQMALTERHRAKMESDELGEIRAWKLRVGSHHVASDREGPELLAGVNCLTERQETLEGAH